MTSRIPAIMALVRKELLATVKEPLNRMILVAPVFFYILLFGYIASFNLNTVPYALCDLSGSEASAGLVRMLDGNAIFDRKMTLGSTAQAAEAIDSGEVFVVVVIPQSFARDISRGSAEIQVIVDGRNSTTGQLAAGYVTYIAQAYNTRVLGLEESAGSRLYFNPNNITQWFILPGLILMLTMLEVVVLSSLSVAREREQGTFEQLLVAPYRTWELLFAKALVPICVGIFQGSLILLACLFWFEIPFAGTLPRVYLVLFIFVLSVTGLGLAISAASSTMQQSLLWALALLVPMVLLSGLFTPVENMPQWVQVLTWFDPLRYGLLAMRRTYLAGISPAEIIIESWPAIAFACVALPAAYRNFKRRI